MTKDRLQEKGGRRRYEVRFLFVSGLFSTSVKGGLISVSTLFVVFDLIEQRQAEALVSGQTSDGGGAAPQNSSA